MNNKKIKVIKKKDLNQEKEMELQKNSKGKETARNMVSNVSSWVNEFQKRKREETKNAFEILLPAGPEGVSS